MDGMGQKGISRRGMAALMAALILFGMAMTVSAAAADKGEGGETGRYQVVSGSDDKAYLVDTATGAAWVLTYRTMATGREPIAIPYKFIRIAPTNQGEFLIENAGDNASMPPSGFR